MRWLRVGIGAAGALGLFAVAAAAGEPQPGDLFVISEFDGIERVDRASGASTPVAHPSLPPNPKLAIDAAGRGLVRGSAGAVLRVDLGTGDVTPIGEGGLLNDDFSRGIAADGLDAIATSTIEIEEVERSAIVRVDPAGGQDLVADVPPHATAVAVEADGSILVLYALKILRVDPATGDSVPVAEGDRLVGPHDIDVLPDGTIAVLHLDPERGIVLVDPVTGVQSLPEMPTALEGEIDLNRATGFATDEDGTFYVTTGRGSFSNEAFPGGLVSLVPGGLARGITDPSEFSAPSDVAVPEPGAALLLAAGASLLLFLRLARG
jgi:hypothetical protein